MRIEEFKTLLKLFSVIGVYTLGDLQLFLRYQGKAGKPLIDCTIDYVVELVRGEDYYA